MVNNGENSGKGIGYRHNNSSIKVLANSVHCACWTFSNLMLYRWANEDQRENVVHKIILQKLLIIIPHRQLKIKLWSSNVWDNRSLCNWSITENESPAWNIRALAMFPVVCLLPDTFQTENKNSCNRHCTSIEWWTFSKAYCRF